MVSPIHSNKNLCVYVDDTEMLGDVGKMLLESVLGDDWEVVHILDAKDGMAAILAGTYKANKIAMAILDHEMPDYTGVEIAQARRKLESEKNLPALPLYLHSTKNDELSDFHHLFNRVIPKPMKLKDLNFN